MAEAQPPASDDVANERLIQRCLALLAPVVRLLVACGVTYPRFAAALKRSFFDAAKEELDASGRRATDSALSLLSGLQRRDTRVLGRDNPTGLPPKAERVSTARQVALRWNAEVEFLAPDGTPRPLPFRADDDGPSFSKLAQSVSKAQHPAAVLDEMVRLKLAEYDGSTVHRISEPLVRGDFEQMTLLMSQNVRDHLAAAVANVRGREPRFIEHSLFSDELRAESVAELHALLLEHSRELFRHARLAAVQKSDRDRELGFTDAPEMRMRFGVYFYSEPMPPRSSVVPAAEPAAAPAPPPEGTST